MKGLSKSKTSSKERPNSLISEHQAACLVLNLHKVIHLEEEMPEDFTQLASKAANNPDYIAYALSVYQREHSVDDDELARQLECSVTDLVTIRLTRLPRPYHFNQDIAATLYDVVFNVEALEKMIASCMYLTTEVHRCYVGAGGVTIFNTEGLDLEDNDPSEDILLMLSPKEAVELAEYILARRDALLQREAALTEQFEKISQMILPILRENWLREVAEKKRQATQRHREFQPDFYEFRRILQDAFNQLVIQKQRGEFWAWYKATFDKDRFSHDQIVRLFWRYFERQHEGRLIEEYFPDGIDNDTEFTDY